jgi:hypothetical protein
MSCARPKTMESKLPSPVPLPAWERVRVRAARLLRSGIFEGAASQALGSSITGALIGFPIRHFCRRPASRSKAR